MSPQPPRFATCAPAGAPGAALGHPRRGPQNPAQQTSEGGYTPDQAMRDIEAVTMATLHEIIIFAEWLAGLGLELPSRSRVHAAYHARTRRRNRRRK